MDYSILYEADVTELKNKDKRSRILRWILTITIEMAILGVLITLFDLLLPLIGYAFFIYLTFPAPFYVVPNKYKITKKGILLNKKRHFRIKKDYTLKRNEKRMFISIFRNPKKIRGVAKIEILRLYTTELDKVHELLVQTL